MLRFSHLVNPFVNCLFVTAVLSLSIELFVILFRLFTDSGWKPFDEVMYCK